MPPKFEFKIEYNLPMLLGLKAKNVYQLTENLKNIPAASVYFHTHSFLVEHHFLIPEPPNDFATWLRNILNLKELGEKVSSINTVEFRSIDDLRNSIVSAIEDYPYKDAYSIRCTPGDEFQFVSCKTYVLHTPYTADTIDEFVTILEKISIQALQYHIYEPRLRLGKERNDFSDWFLAIGEKELAYKISRIDPYTTTLEGLREELIMTIRKYAVNIH